MGDVRTAGINLSWEPNGTIAGRIGGVVLSGLKQGRPIVGTVVEIHLTEEGRGLVGVAHPGRMFVGSARGSKVGHGGGRWCRHAVAHDILGRYGLRRRSDLRRRRVTVDRLERANVVVGLVKEQAVDRRRGKVEIKGGRHV